jgi:hypothetical protein
MFYSMYLSSKWSLTKAHRPVEDIIAYLLQSLHNPPTNRNIYHQKSHKTLTNSRNRPLRTPPLVLASLRALPNPARPLLQSPRQQPRVQHRCAVQISGSRPRRRRDESLHDLPQLQRQRRHVSRPAPWQRRRRTRPPRRHWRRQSSDDSQLPQLNGRQRDQHQRRLRRFEWW